MRWTKRPVATTLSICKYQLWDKILFLMYMKMIVAPEGEYAERIEGRLKWPDWEIYCGEKGYIKFRT